MNKKHSIYSHDAKIPLFTFCRSVCRILLGKPMVKKEQDGMGTKLPTILFMKRIS
jgi:hypothetical protein